MISDAMTGNDIFKITIKVADIPPFKLSIRRDSEEVYRRAVDKINSMWKDLKVKSHASEQDDRIIAVIAIRFASQLYSTLDKVRRYESERAVDDAKVKELMTDFEQDIDSILMEIK